MNSNKIVSIALALFTLGIGSTSAATFSPFSGTTGIPHTIGVFKTDGNAGIVSFDSSDGSTAGISGTDITGIFYIETIGLTTFDPGTKIIPPISGYLMSDPWTLSGTATNVWAGTIYLTGITYDISTRKFSGTGMNDWIGMISFDGILSQGGTSGIKIVGGYDGGKKTLDAFYPTDIKFDTSILNNALNKIRKNIAIITRNIPEKFMNTSFGSTTSYPLSNKLIFINTGATIKTLKYSDIKTEFEANSIQSLIVIGGNLIVDDSILNSGTKPKGIIVLKNDNGLGGDLIITKDVKSINGSIFTQGSIYSGDSRTNLYNDTIIKILTLPENQLHIYGSLISHNTMGGAQNTNPVCVYNEVPCTYDIALPYDLNNFRSYPSGSGSLRAYKDATFDSYSIVIERDTRIYSNPPPGFDMK